jgi:hypothetical protein
MKKIKVAGLRVGIKGSLILAAVVILIVVPVSAQQTVMHKSVKIDTTKVISQEELKNIADRIFNRYYKSIYDAEEKALIEKQLMLLENNRDNLLETAQGLSSSGVFMAGAGISKNVSMAVTSKAASLFPRDTLIVNNFGAMLRLSDSVEISLPVLLYAGKLYPGAPVILTNLGNTLFELYDDRSAEVLYKRALQINPDYTLANQGLVSVYLKRKDLEKAVAQLFSAARGVYCPSMKEVQDNIKHRDKYRLPDMPEEPGNEPTPEQSRSQSPDRLLLPDFADWSEIGAILADQSIDKIRKKLAKIAREDVRLKNALEVSNMSKEEREKWYEVEMQPGRILYKKGDFAVGLMEKYFEDRLNKTYRTYFVTDSIYNANYEKALEQILANSKKMEQEIGSDPIKWRAWVTEQCKAATNLTAKYFADWRGIARTRHQEYNDLLSTYWVYCEQYLNTTYNTDDFDELNSRRKIFVAGKLSEMYNEYSMRKMAFGLINISAFASGSGDCPEMPPPPPPSAEEEDVEIPDKDRPDCPFKNKPGKVGLGVCSITLDCESAGLECGQGIIGGAKWNYKKKELTLFGGVGVRGDFGVPGANVSAGAKAGFEVSFNKNNQITDIGFKAEAGASTTIGITESSRGMNIKMTAATGIDTDLTRDLSYKF